MGEGWGEGERLRQQALRRLSLSAPRYARASDPKRLLARTLSGGPLHKGRGANQACSATPVHRLWNTRIERPGALR
jgi:hypothetical protein